MRDQTRIWSTTLIKRFRFSHGFRVKCVLENIYFNQKMKNVFKCINGTFCNFFSKFTALQQQSIMRHL